jgi:ABC-type glycerol-3-phosphate transport system substrate-binding protein
MKKSVKRWAAVALAAAIAVSAAACGGASSSSQNGAATSSTAAKEGKTLNIWCWNDEFQGQFNKFYPNVKGVAKDKSTTTLKDGTVVKWTINPNDNNNYQNKLDAALQAQDSAKTDDKIDMFLVEADYALKYVDSEYTLDIKKDVGLTDDDLSNQYQYTKDIVTDKNKAIKGTSWQATPGLFAYRRSIAKKVLGTDDPDKVQEQLSDWAKFDAVAKKNKYDGLQDALWLR